MKTLNVITVLSLLLLWGCGGGSGDQQAADDTAGTQEKEMATDVRTIDIYGINAMKFVVHDEAEGISVGQTVQDSLLVLESITAQPGETIRVRLTTISDMPPSAMSHNWLLLDLDADTDAFATAASQARENDYVPADMEDMVIAETGLVPGGETKEVTFTVPEEIGTYDFLCTFPGHYLAGMTGEFIVAEEGESMAPDSGTGM
ncbi:MAG TPA: plastocyanin/azurin family copper-binding protein [Balneolaceae bacterium]|nr:plastocyanin/azurin family copper-binding protein [Balneolaceae bacterium]